jgi:tellurite resistance protein TerC
VLIWIAFLIFIFVLLALDLGVFHRRAHVISVREAPGFGPVTGRARNALSLTF